MAMEYHIINASSFAAANWQLADGSPGLGFVDGATLTVQGGRETVTDDLDYSGLTTGIESLETARARTGDIGTAAVPLVVDADASADAFIKHGAQSGTMHVNAGGLSATINNAYLDSPGGRLELLGGTVSNVETTQGALYVAAGCVVTSAYLDAGSSVFDYNATPLGTLELNGGYHTLKRDAGKVDVYGATTLFIDIDLPSLAMDLRIHDDRATVIRVRGAVPDVLHRMGAVDLVKSERDEGWAQTSHIRWPRSVLRVLPSQTVGDAVWRGGSSIEVGSPQPLP